MISIDVIMDTCYNGHFAKLQYKVSKLFEKKHLIENPRLHKDLRFYKCYVPCPTGRLSLLDGLAAKWMSRAYFLGQ
jgi:hypothetical protein